MRKIYITQKGWKEINRLETFYVSMANDYIIIECNDFNLASKFGQVYRVKYIPLDEIKSLVELKETE